jgi:hypothetical protein
MLPAVPSRRNQATFKLCRVSVESLLELVLSDHIVLTIVEQAAAFGADRMADDAQAIGGRLVDIGSVAAAATGAEEGNRHQAILR